MGCSREPRQVLAGLMLALWVAACGAESPTGPSLWDEDAVLAVLTESGKVSLPSDTSVTGAPRGTRFVAGWQPWRHRGRTMMAAGRTGARLQVVHLADRSRTLYLDLLDPTSEVSLPGRGESGVEVRVTPVGRPPSWTEVVDVTWSDPVAIPLPSELPTGRLLVEIVRRPGSPAVDIGAAQLRPNLPAGDAHLAGGDLVQTGWSRVEEVRRVTPGEELVGAFEPPENPREGQAFRAWVEDAQGAVLSDFEWRAGHSGRERRVVLVADLAADQSTDQSLHQTTEFVRFVFQAEGEGPAGTWREFRWRAPRQPWPSGRTASAPPASVAKTSVRGESGEATASVADQTREPAREPTRLVMVYVMDALRADYVGTAAPEETRRTTPFDPGRFPGTTSTFDRLAGEGRVFTGHRSIAPSTLPSTRALFRGRIQPEARDAGEAVMLAEHFRRAGYRTALFSGNPYVGPAYGLDQGFDHVAEGVLYEESSDPASNEAVAYNDNAAQVHAAALDWLADLPAGQRAFVYLHTIHPHNPYHPPPDLEAHYTAGFRSRIDGSTDTLFAVQRQRRAATAPDRARLAALYAAAFAYNDRELAAFLEGVADHVAEEDTWLALTSDHGEELFDHDGVLHGYTLYEEQLRVPLVLWAPGRLSPGRAAEPTTTLDLRATLLALLPGQPPVSTDGGRSLLNGGRSRSTTVETSEAVTAPRLLVAAAPNARDGLVSLRLGDWKYIAAPGGPRTWGMGLGRGRSRDPEYVFDLARDPWERRNLAGLGGIEEDWLRARLHAWRSTRRATTDADATPTDPETRKRLEALGYLR